VLHERVAHRNEAAVRLILEVALLLLLTELHPKHPKKLLPKILADLARSPEKLDSSWSRFSEWASTWKRIDQEPLEPCQKPIWRVFGLLELAPKIGRMCCRESEIFSVGVWVEKNPLENLVRILGLW
jgi:hypothetical protein